MCETARKTLFSTDWILIICMLLLLFQNTPNTILHHAVYILFNIVYFFIYIKRKLVNKLLRE